ncbi:MAG: recombinase family protein [Planctomycetota bacterium]
MTIAKPRASAATVRVAVYTRKSVTEGLDQEFNTLDAQREAVEAYIASQRAEGWVALEHSYDDGGFSGANTDRPAFQRLLADVEAGQVDVIAVYRLDRLSRSLADFARLMEFLNARGVAFVSVTERFDTSTPMGRMVLNLLATFAQFERETIAQRTKDKILASRRRGMWTGGRPVLGYDVVDKRLVVNEDEAERVRAMFALYLELGSLLAVVDELKRRGWEGKSWTNKKGELVRGRAFTKTTLHHALRNPLYAGKVRAGDETYDGEHEAIVDEKTWAAVQTQLTANGRELGRRKPRRSKEPALLSGLARCSCGAAMTHHWTGKGDRRYSYYVCARRQKEGAAACPGSRVAAGELEAFVVDRIRAVGRDPDVLEATIEADRREREERRPELEGELKRLRAGRTRLERERRNLTDAVAGGKRDAGLLQKLGEIGLELDAAEVEVSAAERELDSLSDDLDADELAAALADLEPVWAELFPVERARVLALLVERVEFDAETGEVEIRFRPGGPATLAEEGL